MSQLTVGLTGGIASGKSLVESQFRALGVPVLDADQVSRDVVAPPSPALDEIAERFGAEFITAEGTLDRRRMRELVFSDAGAKQRLEAILHPHIRQRLKQWRDAQTAPYCIISVAILLETGMRTLVDRVLVVDVPVETQMTRLTVRDGIAETLASSMIAAQTHRQVRLDAAHDVIQNIGTPEQTQREVARLHQLYLQLAGTQS
ncbi:dephospho-CoA kinase [Stenotrophobium rhamnosiphilum]|uniref:Dephospho-CoA kinase n=1 Tax=Stenotrophobium rhamnosiphilum TaxID=2029166 RepID=A0A2T5MDL9_9GAMM|nr:dephospho-CoA kinase [Stenotrophobium rhamnosiphilum]PTU30678.1 dephospho-CoA kinase [Stenotrophobium rhamnosiphilum]